MRSSIVTWGAGLVAVVAMTGGVLQGAQSPALGPAQAPAAGAPDGAAERPPVEVRTTVNRTAASVGDPILWTVELTCAPMVDVVADDLAGETFVLEGLELVGSETERTPTDDGGLIHRVRYEFRTYEINLKALKVAPVPVRYFVRRAGQRPEDLEPAGQVEVPGLLLAWHSTIPSGITRIDPRDQRPAESIPVWLTLARPIGLALVVVSFAPVAIWGFSRLRRIRLPQVRRLSARASRREAQRALRELLGADTTTEAARREAYARLGAVLRRFRAATAAAPARGLAGKMAGWFQRNEDGPAAQAVAETLEQCELACYGPAQRVPSADQFRDSLALLERVL